VTLPADRQQVAVRGKRLEYFTIAWNTLEGVVAVAAGALAGSISLVGFGIDSFIEVTSGQRAALAEVGGFRLAQAPAE